MRRKLINTAMGLCLFLGISVHIIAETSDDNAG